MNVKNQCLSPVVVPRFSRELPLFRCGKCVNCLRQLKNELSVRSYRESFGSKFVFLTFTYDNDHCPIQVTDEYVSQETGEILKESVDYVTDSSFFEDASFIWRLNKDNKRTKRYFPHTVETDEFITHKGQIVPVVKIHTRYFSTYIRHTQLLFKRFRKAFPGALRKFILVPEYGSVGYRPHFHLMVYDLSNEQLKYLVDNWIFGHVQVDFPEFSKEEDVRKISSYLAKYAVKGQFDCPFIGRYCRKNRRSVSENFGCGDVLLFRDLQSYLLAWDIYGEYNPKDVNLSRFSDRDLKYLSTRRVYNINGFNYPFPKYLIRKIMYETEKVYDATKDAFVYRTRATELQKAISDVVLAEIIRDARRKFPKDRRNQNFERENDSIYLQNSQSPIIFQETDTNYLNSYFVSELERSSLY